MNNSSTKKMMQTGMRVHSQITSGYTNSFQGCKDIAINTDNNQGGYIFMRAKCPDSKGTWKDSTLIFLKSYTGAISNCEGELTLGRCDK